MNSERYERLKRLSRTSPIVDRCLQMRDGGEPMEEVLVRCIEELERARAHAENEAVKYAMMLPPSQFPVGEVK